VNHVDYCAGYGYAITSSTRVHLYDERLRPTRTITRFKDTAYCGTFRSDGKLVAAGGENGVVQVFDANSRSLLRQMTSHKRAVHTVAFARDKLHLLSAGDDATVRWWDVSSGEQIFRLDGHTDYVRAAALSPQSEELVATGGYDHMCKLWDVRSNEQVASFDHGQPIESIAFFPSESLVLTAGGQKISCWDITGGRLLHQFSAHQKTVSVVKVVDVEGELRVLTGSLDGHIKVFDPANFKMLYACKYPSPVLSLDIAKDSNTLAVGLADGTLSFRKRRVTKDVNRKGYTPRLTAANYRYFFRNQALPATDEDLVVAKQKKAALAEHDKLLRKFRYADALDRALAGQRPEVVFAVIEEIRARGGLELALRGLRDDSSALVSFMSKHVRDPRYSKDAIAISGMLLDIVGPLDDSAVAHGLHVLRERANEEIKACERLLELGGMVDMLMASSMAGL
jgi:U3 small nucleolar RNA-associated protein 15